MLADYNGDRIDRLVYALDAASWRTWTSRSNGDGRVDLSLDANDQTSWRAWVAGRPSTCSMHRRAIQLYVEVGCQRYLTLVL